MVFWTQAVGVTGWALGIWVTGSSIHVPAHMWGWIALAALCAGVSARLRAAGPSQYPARDLTDRPMAGKCARGPRPDHVTDLGRR